MSTFVSTDNDSVRRAVRWALACGLTCGFAFSASAIAADQSQTAAPSAVTSAAPAALKAVEVTGTRIKRTSVEQAQPIEIITQAQIKQAGLTTIGQVLQTISSSGSALNTQNNNDGNATTQSAGQTYLNLRNLGSQRTLILVNGHRWITDLNGSVDLNTIPTSIIDHVEILQDGASAIYGSDAIAGVVNIITIKNFSGANANVYIGIHQGDGHWDGQVKNYNAAIGGNFDGGRGNVVMNASYEDEEAVPAGNRALSAVPIYGTGNTRGSPGTEQGTYQFIPPYGGSLSSPNNFPAASTGLTAAQCPAKPYSNTQGQTIYYPYCFLTTTPGTPGTQPSDFQPFTAADNYNYAPGNFLISPDQRFSLYLDGHYDLADNLTFTLEATAGQRHSGQSAAPNPLGVSGSSVSADMPAGQDFNPFGFDLNTAAPVGPGQLINIDRRIFEAGDRINTQDENFVHLRGGFTGFFDVGSSEWDWDGGYSFSKDTEADSLQGVFDGNRITTQISDPAVCAAQASLGCTPINFFGGVTNPITPAMLAYASYVDSYKYQRNSRGIYADMTNSDIADLPAGPVGLAFGYQYLGNSGFYQPSAIDLQQPNPPEPTSGTNSINAVYAEIDTPLVANVPMMKLLDLDIATRRTEAQANKTDSEFNTSSRAGLKWQVSDSLMFRGTWSQGFRAPDISELFAGRQTSSTDINDPCNQYGTSGVPQSVQNICAAQGVPPGYIQSNVQLATQSGGNMNLKPETSISRTVGFVYSPDWLSGFNMNMDYYKIELENTIQEVAGQDIFNQCYYADISSACAKISRLPNGSGQVREVTNTVTNIGGTLTSGIDLGGSYEFPMTSVGQFKLNLGSTYTRQYNMFIPDGTGGVTTIRLAGNERSGQVLPTGIPRWKATLGANWSLGGWSASWQMRYFSSMQVSCSDYLDGTPDSLTNMGVCNEPNVQDNSLSMDRIAAVVFNDAQVSYAYDPWNTTFTFGINNVFGVNPPENPTSTLNSFDTSLYPIPGRFFYASVGVKF